MPCFSPMQAVVVGKTKLGKQKLKFVGLWRNQAPDTRVSADSPLLLPCGNCVACRLERSRQWAIRIMHEASLHDENCFITLTFNDRALSLREEEFGTGYSLNKRDFQLFMKRFRKAIFPLKVRFFHCGEYGTEFGRPHYHACIFGYDFSDKRFYKERNGNKLFTSDFLSSLWCDSRGVSLGYCSVGSLTFDSAAYVARYIVKKVNGDKAADHYIDINFSSGEVFTLVPEYVTMSRCPGIGRNWFDVYGSHTYYWDYIIMNGHKVRPPKFYDSIFEITSPADFAALKDKRKCDALKRTAHTTPARLLVREKLQKRRLSMLPRNLDGDL